MKLKVVQWVLALLLLAPCTQAQSIWDATHLANVKQSIHEPFYATAYQALQAEADKLLDVQPLSVMMKEKVPASGNKHDYMSQARYYWPHKARRTALREPRRRIEPRIEQARPQPPGSNRQPRHHAGTGLVLQRRREVCPKGNGAYPRMVLRQGYTHESQPGVCADDTRTQRRPKAVATACWIVTPL